MNWLPSFHNELAPLVEQKDCCLSERIPDFANKFAEIMFWAAKLAVCGIAMKQVDLLSDTHLTSMHSMGISRDWQTAKMCALERQERSCRKTNSKESRGEAAVQRTRATADYP